MHRNLVGRVQKIRCNKLIPCKGQERTAPPRSSITMTHKKPKSASPFTNLAIPSPTERILWFSVALKPKINTLKIWFSIYHYSKPHYLIFLVPSYPQTESYAWPALPLLWVTSLHQTNVRVPLQQDSCRKWYFSALYKPMCMGSTFIKHILSTRHNIKVH